MQPHSLFPMRATMTPARPARRAGRRTSAGAVALAAVGLLGGCSTDKLLTVSNPGIAQPSSLSGTSGLAAYYAAAIGDFIVGYAGDGGTYEGLINYGGLLADEVGSVDTFTTRNETDARSTQPSNATNADIFRAIQRSRSTAELAEAQFAKTAPTDARLSEVTSLAGFSYVAMAESYCSGIPFSSLASDGTTLVYGQPNTTDQVLQIAVAKFDTALTLATAAKVDSLANLARVGRARALLDLNDVADAATQAAAVSTTFTYYLYTSSNTTRQYNGIYYFDNINKRFSAIDREGGNGLPYLSANDPRVPYFDTGGPGFDGAREWITQLKYPQRTSPIPLATGAEARLIQAEGALAAGAPTQFLSYLAQARTAVGDTATITDPGDQTGRVNLLFRERAFTLWLTGHRLGDMRRLIRFYNRGAETVFPTGAYSGQGISAYGTDVNLPIPVQEQNNPNYTGACNKAAP
ncbi:hypothetical protein tb265_45220 [Gemmatimonadetes bacterium T265]|nr:hypothetical protein tb265_45220 [Gemmatimonadetes bacterium T265]